MSERYSLRVCTDIMLKKYIDNDVYILLMKRENTGFDDGKYELPGGHLEAGEDIFESMIREAKEELLIDLKKDDLKIIHILHHYNGNRINFIFEADLNNLEPKIGEPNKCSEIRWVKINELPDEVTDKVKLMISNIINNKFYDKL